MKIRAESPIFIDILGLSSWKAQILGNRSGMRALDRNRHFKVELHLTLTSILKMLKKKNVEHCIMSFHP